MKKEGFADLRGAQTAALSEGGVWPAFTSVMVVILLVFVLAVVVMLIRNVDLEQSLRETTQQSESRNEQKTALEFKAANLGDEIAGLRIRAGEMAQHLEHAAATIHARDQEISQLIGKVVGLETLQARLAQENGLLVARGKSLEGELLALEQSYQALVALRGELEGEVTRLKADKAALAQTGNALKVKLDRVSGERDRLGQTHRALLVQHKDLQGAERSLTDKVEVLSAEKTTLQARVKELKGAVRGLRKERQALVVTRGELEGEVTRLKADKAAQTPVRSAAGKYVVEIRYWTDGINYFYSVQEPAEPRPRTASNNELHEILAALKFKYKQQLYIKVLFPRGEELSHDDAWAFTQGIYRKYDYYYW